VLVVVGCNIHRTQRHVGAVTSAADHFRGQQHSLGDLSQQQQQQQQQQNVDDN